MEQIRRKRRLKRRRKPSAHFLSKILGRTFYLLAMILFLFCFLFFGTLTIICYGPSSSAKNLFVETVTQTSAAGFLAKIYFSESEIADILKTDAAPVSSVNTITDTGAVQVSASTDDSGTDGITIKEVSGGSYSGKMMIIDDPSRVSVYSIPSFNTGGTGEQLLDMINETGSIAGINAGGFYDPDGKGHGGMPLGPVIQNGTLISNYESTYTTLIGFDSSHKLMVGNISASEAIAAGMTEGITFGPALVINGERVPYETTAGGLNPRSAIGQRSDGAILLLVIDGRQPHSLGASFKDLCDVMLDYGAVNAANLDGGSSSLLYYQGSLVNNSASMIGLRPIPTAILVK